MMAVSGSAKPSRLMRIEENRLVWEDAGMRQGAINDVSFDCLFPERLTCVPCLLVFRPARLRHKLRIGVGWRYGIGSANVDIAHHTSDYIAILGNA